MVRPDTRPNRRSKSRRQKKPSPPFLPLLAGILFLAAVSALVWLEELPRWLLVTYIVLSVLTFLVYGWDKRAARLQQARVAESTLHLLAVIGGWPGALIAQNRLRHKSRKASFLLIFWCTVIVNLIFVYWLIYFA